MTGRRVSIAMTTYNGERYLAEQLESFSAQTRLPDQLVIGDDGSSDGTLALLAAFAQRAPFPVRVTANPVNLGPTRNFCETILRCDGDVILLCDQDDRWEPRKIATMLAHLAASPGCLLATHDAALMDGEGHLTGRTMGEQIAAAGGNPARGLVAGCCMAIDVRLARLFDPPAPIHTHDAWISAIADRLGVRCWVDEPLIAYRRHGTNVSESYMSRLDRASRLHRSLDRLTKARGQPVAKALDQSISDLGAMVAAIRAHESDLADVVPAERCQAATRELEFELERDQRRRAIHDGPHLQRFARLASALAEGVYSGPGGKLSLVRDLHGCAFG